VAEHPELGPTYSHDPSYQVDDAAETFWIVGAWSALRGSGAELP
jgi:hypothetical protein